MTRLGYELPPSKVEEIPDVDPDDRLDGYVLGWDDATQTHRYLEPGSDAVTGWQVEHPTVDTVVDGAGIEATITSRWGVTPDGMPYFNPTEVDAGDEASLLRSDTGYTLRPRTLT